MVSGIRTTIALLLALLAMPAWALDLDYKLEAEGRWFHSAEVAAWSPSAAATVDAFQGWDRRRQRIVAQLFGRADLRDDRRSHTDVRELYYAWLGREIEFRAGVRRVFWGVTESRHLVDIINQSDFVENIDNEDKLGQPMIDVSLIESLGTLQLFVLPYQRQQTFPGPDGHPQLPYPVDTGETRYAHGRGPRHVDTALRYHASFGGLDLGLSVFDGTAREPGLLPCLRQGSGYAGTADGPNCDIFAAVEVPQSPLPEALTSLLQQAGLLPSDQQVAAQITADVERNLVLVPYYDRLRQFGIDAQYLTGGWAWKLEAVDRQAGRGNSSAAVAGFEYSFASFFATGWDVGLLGEWHYENRDGVLDSRYDHDAFAGLRVSLNDVPGTMLLGGVLLDRSGEDQFYQLEASRRIGDACALSLTWREFAHIPRNSLTRFLDKEDMLSLSLAIYL